jgi:hypothetical protein
MFCFSQHLSSILVQRKMRTVVRSETGVVSEAVGINRAAPASPASPTSQADFRLDGKRRMTTQGRSLVPTHQRAWYAALRLPYVQ